MVMTEANFSQVFERLQAMNITDPNTRLLRRLILANAYPVEIDKIGRIHLAPNLRSLAGIQNGELAVVGQGDYFEVWTPAEWQLQMEKLLDTEANNARFTTLDLSKNASSS